MAHQLVQFVLEWGSLLVAAAIAFGAVILVLIVFLVYRIVRHQNAQLTALRDESSARRADAQQLGEKLDLIAAALKQR